MSTLKTAIAWTGRTWNPTRGCSRTSPGCLNCYAERVAARFCGPGQPYEGLVSIHKKGDRTEARWNGRTRLVEHALAEPLRWRKPARVFVDSMSDLFHDGFSNEQIAAVFGVMAAAHRHTFQVLTKRAERMGHWFRWIAQQAARVHDGDGEVRFCAAATYAEGTNWGHGRRGRLNFEYPSWPLSNVHLGVSVENQETADERIPWLIEVPATVRFVSLEPLLEWVDLENVHPSHLKRDPETENDPIIRLDALRGHLKGPDEMQDGKIDWVIIGGESGGRARLFNPTWAKDMVSVCRAAGVPVFVKQMGSNPLSVTGVKLRDKAGADPAEWPEELRVQEFPR